MATQVTKPAATGLSTDLASRLLSGIGQSRSATTIPGGKPLLRLTKGSGWVFGQNDEPVQDGSSWVANPLSIMHGFCAWTRYDAKDKKTNELVGEVMVPIYEAKPAKPDPVGEAQWPYAEQRSIEMKCLDGDDAGTEVLYKNSSLGGMRSFDGVLAALQAQLQKDPNHPCPVLQFGIDSYKHKVWGEVLVPIFDIVGWADMNGNLAEETEDNGAGPQTTEAATEEEAEEDVVELATAPAQTTRKAAAAKAEPAPKAAKAPPKASLRKAAPAEPAPTSRRRPVRR
jgi:hypothetical protein